MKNYKVYYTTDRGNFSDIIRMDSGTVLKEIEVEKDITMEVLSSEIISTTDSASNVELIKKADFVIANISTNNSNVIYEIGVAHALNKPTIVLLFDEIPIPEDLIGTRYVSYNGKTKANVFTEGLKNIVLQAIETPNLWKIDVPVSAKVKELKTVFVSYSHKDDDYLKRLQVHMKSTERKGQIQFWSDNLIQGGDKWRHEIEKALRKASVAILLISADFLASDFIINNELQPLLKQAEEKGTTIIPVILKPCRFLREQSISQFQSINDPINPMCKLSEFEQEDIYERIAQRVEVILHSV